MSDIIDPTEFIGMKAVEPVQLTPKLMWNKEVSAAKDGRLEMTTCPHPMYALEQFVDQLPNGAETPVNLWRCPACSRILRLVDGHGRSASDATV